MGFWAGIKYALNSTLGTDKFKSLDKILEDYTYDNKSLVASENLLYIAYSGYINAKHEEYQQVPIKITMRNNGSITLKSDASPGTWEHNITIRIYKNGVYYRTFMGGIDKLGEYTEPTTTISFDSGDILTFDFVSSVNNGYLADIRVYADVVDTSLIKVEEV